MNKQNVPVIIQEHKLFLAQWLRERDMERIMTTIEHPEEDAECSGRDAGPAVHHETGESPGNHASDPIQPGQIRLLARGVGGVENRLLYAAVLSAWNAEPKEWLIVPFSAYTTPALRGELLLRPSGALSLRVLCLWNARNLSDETLCRSWLVDELNDEEQRRASLVLRYALHGDPLPEELHPRIGPPILKPDDPRRAYQQEEIALWDGVQQETCMEDCEIPVLTNLPHWQPESCELLQAAGDGEVVVTPLIRQDRENKELELVDWLETDAQVRIHPDGIEFGPVQWALRNKSSIPDWAHGTVYVYWRPTGVPIGVGRFDETGRIVTWRHVITESIQETISNLEELALVLFGK